MRKKKRKPIICCFVGDKKPPKPSKENKDENLILIEDKDKIFGSLLIKSLDIIFKLGVMKNIVIVYQKLKPNVLVSTSFIGSLT